MSVTVVAYANQVTPGYTNYKKTLDRLGYNYQFLGMGEKWNGFMTKIAACLKYVSSADPYSLIAITDCYDVLAVGTPKELTAKWMLCSKPILFSAERRTLFTNGTNMNGFWKGSVRPVNECLNAGFYMGLAKDLKVALAYALASKESDDQYAMCLFADEHPEYVDLDSRSNIMGTISGIIHDYQVVNSRVHYVPDDTYPVFIHIPGDHVDLGIRMDHYGSRLLGDEYVKIDYMTRLKTAFSKFSVIQKVVASIVIGIAIYFYPRITLVALGAIVMFLILLPVFK